MKIDILCSDFSHPIFNRLIEWNPPGDHEIGVYRRKETLKGGDFLFLISCSQIVTKEDRAKYKHVLVVHASDLPRGRGWSPHIWTVVKGGGRIIVSLIEADDLVDTGDIWKQTDFFLDGHELYDEINEKLFNTTFNLMEYAIANPDGPPGKRPQLGKDEATYWPKRTPEHSRLCPEMTISDQLNLLRVCDPQRYPAFFDLRGYRYKITIEKMGPLPNG